MRLGDGEGTGVFDDNEDSAKFIWIRTFKMNYDNDNNCRTCFLDNLKKYRCLGNSESKRQRVTHWFEEKKTNNTIEKSILVVNRIDRNKCLGEKLVKLLNGVLYLQLIYKNLFHF